MTDFMKGKVLVTQSCLTLCDPMGPSVHEDSPGKNTGVGCHSHLQRIFLTQRSKLGLLHWQVDSLLSESLVLGKPLNFLRLGFHICLTGPTALTSQGPEFEVLARCLAR